MEHMLGKNLMDYSIVVRKVIELWMKEMGLLHVYVLRSVYHCLWWCGFALVVLWLILGVVLFVISRIYSAVVHDFSIRCGCISAFRVLCIVIWLIFTVDWKNLLIQRRCYWCISIMIMVVFMSSSMIFGLMKLHHFYSMK